MAENNRRRVVFRASFVIAHADAIRLGELKRRHFQHRQSLFFLGMIFSENRYPLCANAALWVRIMPPELACGALQIARWRERGLQRGELARQHVTENLHM